MRIMIYLLNLKRIKVVYILGDEVVEVLPLLRVGVQQGVAPVPGTTCNTTRGRIHKLRTVAKFRDGWLSWKDGWLNNTVWVVKRDGWLNLRWVAKWVK
jgi:hypothetical protein